MLLALTIQFAELSKSGGSLEKLAVCVADRAPPSAGFGASDCRAFRGFGSSVVVLLVVVVVVVVCCCCCCEFFRGFWVDVVVVAVCYFC